MKGAKDLLFLQAPIAQLVKARLGALLLLRIGILLTVGLVLALLFFGPPFAQEVKRNMLPWRLQAILIVEVMADLVDFALRFESNYHVLKDFRGLLELLHFVTAHAIHHAVHFDLINALLLRHYSVFGLRLRHGLFRNFLLNTEDPIWKVKDLFDLFVPVKLKNLAKTVFLSLLDKLIFLTPRQICLPRMQVVLFDHI